MLFKNNRELNIHTKKGHSQQDSLSSNNSLEDCKGNNKNDLVITSKINDKLDVNNEGEEELGKTCNKCGKTFKTIKGCNIHVTM